MLNCVGLGDASTAATPTLVSGADWASVDTFGGSYSSFALSASGDLYAWGMNSCRLTIPWKIALKGGYDSTYSSRNSFSRINSLIVERGTIAVENIVLGP